MALINCNECGKEMSENAEVCPHCGNPNTLTDTQKKEKVLQKEQTEQKAIVFAIIIILVILIAGYLGIKTLWNGLDGNGFMEAMGIEAEGENLTIKSKDQDKMKDWEENAMDWLGFEHTEE